MSSTTTSARRTKNRFDLTRHELRALVYSAAGYTAAETAAKLGVGVETIKTQRDSFKEKLGASNAPNAVALALIHDLLSPESRQRILRLAEQRRLDRQSR